MGSAIILSGFLLKKKKEDKRSFLASKYQKRWFELTSDTLAYAKDPKELKAEVDGDIEVFAIHELKYIKKLDDEKLEMKFPERVLKVRAESTADFEKWYEAIKDARQKKLDGQSTAQAKQLENLKLNATKAMCSDSEDEGVDAGRPVTPPKRSGADATRGLAAGPASGGTGAGGRPGALQMPSATLDAQSGKPPSPRSLLANPKMATKLVATPARAPQQPREEEEEEEEEGPVAARPRSRWQDEDDEEAVGTQAAGGSRPGTSGSGPGGAGPARKPQPEKLTLLGDAAGSRAGTRPPSGTGSAAQGANGGGGGGVASGTAPRGERLHLGDGSAKALPSPARRGLGAGGADAEAGPRARGGSPSPAPAPRSGQKLTLGTQPAPAGGSRPGSREAPGPAANGKHVSMGTAAAGATEDKVEAFGEEDWDSSGSEQEDEGERRKQQQAAAQPPARGASPRTGAGGPSGGRPPLAPAVQQQAGRPQAQRQESEQAVQLGGGSRPRPPPPAAPQEEEEEEEDSKPLAKHAAGTDHLEDDWDSDDGGEEEEEAESAKGKRPSPAPLAQPQPQQRQPASRIPAPPRPPQAPPARASPAPPPQAAAPAGRRQAVAQVLSPSPPPQPPKAEQPQGFKSNVVHDPNVRTDSNWVEEDWDDEDE